MEFLINLQPQSRAGFSFSFAIVRTSERKFDKHISLPRGFFPNVYDYTSCMTRSWVDKLFPRHHLTSHHKSEAKKLTLNLIRVIMSWLKGNRLFAQNKLLDYYLRSGATRTGESDKLNMLLKKFDASWREGGVVDLLCRKFRSISFECGKLSMRI